MNRSRSLRRLVLGAAVAGAAIGAAPAMAGAATTCSYDFAAQQMTINDGSGSLALRVVRSGNYIAYANGRSTPQICWGPVTIATATNVDNVNVIESGTNGEGGIQIDESEGKLAPGATPEADGNSEIEITVSGNGTHPGLRVIGTAGPDVMKVGGSGGVNLGPDTDTDVSVADGPGKVMLEGGGGDDYLSGEGGATVPLTLSGLAGNDVLVGGLGPDRLFGGADADNMLTADLSADTTVVDTVYGDTGDDTAKIDSKDVAEDAIEHLQVLG